MSSAHSAQPSTGQNVEIGPTFLQRAFAALEALADGPSSSAEVARTLGVNRSTALRLLSELETTGYVRRDSRTKRYSIVPARFYRLGAAHESHADWAELVDPALSTLRDEFGEASIMGVPANGAMVYLAFLPSPHLVAVRERLGTTRPMHCSALGKAYLSALAPQALDAELALLSFQGGTELGARGPLELRERLERARDVGYAVDRNETFDGGTCVAAPLRLGDALVGAIGLSGPSSRFTDDRIAQMGARVAGVATRLTGLPARGGDAGPGRMEDPGVVGRKGAA